MKSASLILEFPKVDVCFNREDSMRSIDDRLRVFVDGVYTSESNCGEQERAARAIVDSYFEVMLSKDLPHTQATRAVQNLTECFEWKHATQIERDTLFDAGVSYLGVWGPSRLVTLINAGVGPFKKHPAELIGIASTIVSMKRWYKSNKFEISQRLAHVPHDLRQQMFNELATSAFDVIYSEGKRMRLFRTADWHMDYEHKITFSIKDPLNTPQNYNYERNLGVLFQLRNQELDVWLPPHVRSVLRENFDADVWHS